MKKALILISIFLFFFISFFVSFQKPVLAQGVSCPCQPEIEPSTGMVLGCWPQSYSYCGVGWSCSCPEPVDGSCQPGTCMAQNPEGHCPNPGDESYGISADNEAEAATACQARGENCSLSGYQAIYTDEYGYKHILYYECCCETEPTPPSSPPPTGATTLLKPECCDIETGDILPTEVCEHLLSSKRGIQTAIGCFPTQPKAIVQWILKYAIMLAGGIGFLLMLYGSFQVMTSAGDPEKLKNGQQILTAAIIGILVIVFSLFLLRFIGWDILKIPGWN